MTNPRKRQFPVRIECGNTPTISLEVGEGAEFEYARMERGENEVVIRLRLKCGHPDHEVIDLRKAHLQALRDGQTDGGWVEDLLGLEHG